MSISVMELISEMDLPPHQKAVLSAYAHHADHDGRNIFPSVARLARRTGYSEREVQRKTRELEAVGILCADGRGPRGVRRWRIDLEAAGAMRAAPAATAARRGDSLPPPGTADGVTSTPAEGDIQSPQTRTGVTSAPAGVTSASIRGVTPMSPESSLTVKESSTRVGLEQVSESANRAVDYILSPPPPQHYAHRERIPEAYLAYADAYHACSGQAPTRHALKDWLRTFSEWAEEGLAPEHIRLAWERAQGERGWPVGRPGALTKTAVGLKAARAARKPRAYDAEREKRVQACTREQLARGAQRAAEFYAARGMPFEPPEQVLARYDRLISAGTDAKPLPEARRLQLLDDVRERMSGLVKSKSV